MSAIANWLSSIGLSEYSALFAENSIDLSVLPDISDGDLKELGLPLGHRRKIMRAISELGRDSQPELAPRQSAQAHRDSAEQRQLTVMFCDLVGSTSISARLDPEDMREVIRAYQTTCARVIDSYDGSVSQFAGDGMLAYFGFPFAHEDDAERAVRAALDIVAAVPRLETPARQPLAARVGIATGVVVIGDLVIPYTASKNAVVGDTPNLAYRLQGLAEPGAVLISSATRRLTAGHFHYRSLGDLAIRGLEEPVPAWLVLGSSEVESRFEAEHGVSLAPLLGREEELELLMRRWRQAADGDGRVALLTGEPGIGKSHIALALQEQAAQAPNMALRFYSSSHHTNSALFPFISHLERAARFQRNDSPDVKLAKLEALLAESNADRGSSIALLANLLSVPLDKGRRLPDLNPQRLREKTLSALLGYLEGRAARQPIMAIFEDAHWADPTSLELLTLIVERTPQLKMLLIITARPEFAPPWPSHAYVTTVQLTRLNRRHGMALVERVTARRILPEEVMDQILSRTDGVPLFVEELTKMVLESGLLQQRDDRFVLGRPLPTLAIPTTLHASLIARLDLLKVDSKEVAQIGAAVGRDFSYELLNAVAKLPKDKLENALGQLVHSELVFCRGEKPHSVYSFKHALVRDAAYAGLLKSRRIELHASIARAFERQFPEIVEAEPESVAHHLTEAGLAEKATVYWRRAGEKAAARSANLEAAAHFRRAICAVNRLPADRIKDRAELDLQLALAPCLIAAEGPASGLALATFSRARELCERLGDLPEYLQVMFWFTTASVVRGELPQAYDAIATLLQRAEARGDRPNLLNAIRGRAMILLFLGRVGEAYRETQRAVELFAASSEHDQLAARSAGQDAGAAGLALMSWALWIIGRPDAAAEKIAAALDRAEAVAHPHTQAYVCYYSSVLHALLGEPAVAHRHAERCLLLSQEHGFRQWLGLSRALRGISLILMDPSSNAVDEVRSAFGDYRRAGYKLGITALDVLFGEALLLRNEPEAALELVERGLSTASRNSERLFEAELYRLKVRALIVRHDPTDRIESESLLDQALRTARAQGARLFELRASRDLAALWMDSGAHAQARDLLAPVVAQFDEGLGSRDLNDAQAMLDRQVRV
ncbi:MAG: AAA family ATPase [Hyphomicrobiales bacterium]|nr:AAA family ATPase [Hyphomicrobiales bacterium]